MTGTYDGRGQGPAEETERDRLQERQDVQNVEPVHVDRAAHQVNDVRTVHG